jgi:HAD superfamily hydrolase (TIGR01484 family)
VTATTRTLLVCDLDGTLLDERGTPAPGIAAALDECAAAGAPLAVCTGRPLDAAETLLERAGLRPVMLACFHGALVLHAGSGAVLRHLTLPAAVAGETLEALHDHGLEVTVYEGRARRESPRAPGPRQATAVTRLIARGPNGSVTAAVRELRRRELPSVSVAAVGAGIVRVQRADATKEDALRLMAAELGLSRGDVIACGDDDSDEGMLRAAGVAIAVGGPSSPLARCANAVVEQAKLGAWLSAWASRASSASGLDRF